MNHSYLQSIVACTTQAYLSCSRGYSSHATDYKNALARYWFLPVQRRILAGEAKLLRMVAHPNIVRCMRVLETRRQQVRNQRYLGVSCGVINVAVVSERAQGHLLCYAAPRQACCVRDTAASVASLLMCMTTDYALRLYESELVDQTHSDDHCCIIICCRFWCWSIYLVVKCCSSYNGSRGTLRRMPASCLDR